MPPKKRASSAKTSPKAKKAKTDSAPTKTTTTRSTRARSGKATVTVAINEDPTRFSATRCRQYFAQYEDSDDKGTIGPEGIEQFCQDLGVPAASLEILVLAWKLGAQTMGYFAKNEWLDGMQRLDVDSTAKLQAKLPEFRAIHDDLHNFKELYMFAFSYAKESDQKSLSLEFAKGMWQLLLPPEKFPHIESFLEFLEEKTPVKVINKDQWKSFLEFSNSVAEDLKGYDESSAWPVLFDEYVEWKKKQLGRS